MSASLKAAKARSLGYQGDPGLFGSIGKMVGRIGGVVGRAGSAIGLPGASVIGQLFKGPRGVMNDPMPGIVAASKLPMVRGMVGAIRRGFGGSGMSSGGGGGGGFGTGMVPGYGQPDDFRHMKFNARSGEWERSRKRRRMNYANGRAIRRAARRLKGAEKMFRTVFTIRHAKAPAGIHPKGRK
jgi:hypothetical protein